MPSKQEKLKLSVGVGAIIGCSVGLLGVLSGRQRFLFLI